MALCRYKTVTLAAENLFITQPSLSARLKTLEKELGGTLFHRKKGNREMSLTSAGKAFYPLAVQYESLIRQMLQVCQNNVNTIRVSAINSIGTYFLPTVYNCFMEQHPDYHLEIQDMELGAVTKSILDGNTDLAFTSGKTVEDRLLQTPIYCEKMVLIVGKTFPIPGKPVSLDDLQKGKEIYIEWSHSYAAWHQQIFLSEHPQITISIMPQLKQLMEHGDCWAIVPISIAKRICEDSLATILDTSFSTQNREISVLTAIDNHSKIVEEFFECIKKVTHETTELQPYI